MRADQHFCRNLQISCMKLGICAYYVPMETTKEINQMNTTAQLNEAIKTFRYTNSKEEAIIGKATINKIREDNMEEIRNAFLTGGTSNELTQADMEASELAFRLHVVFKI